MKINRYTYEKADFPCIDVGIQGIPQDTFGWSYGGLITKVVPLAFMGWCGYT
jgi:hypothetical protein